MVTAVSVIYQGFRVRNALMMICTSTADDRIIETDSRKALKNIENHLPAGVSNIHCINNVIINHDMKMSIIIFTASTTSNLAFCLPQVC